jgi:hypothetical protein
MENALLREVDDIVAQLQKPDHDSDSSGLSSDNGSDLHLDALEVVRARIETREQEQA